LLQFALSEFNQVFIRRVFSGISYAQKYNSTFIIDARVMTIASALPMA
jgi:hypothetical protein